MPAMRHVFSSTVSRIGHDQATQELHVEWTRGKTSIYKGVPAEKAQQVMNAASVGQALHTMIKGQHEHVYAE